MKKLLITVCLISISSAFAGEKINKTLSVSADGVVEIHNKRGKITIKGWDKNKVSVKGRLDDLAEKVVFSRDGDKTIIRVVVPDVNNNGNVGGSKLKIFVPQGTSLIFSGVSVDVAITNIHSGIEVSSVSGSINVSNIKKRTYITNVSGDIKLKSVDGRIEISTVSGNVEADVSARNIVVDGISSELMIRGKDIESAFLSTVSGDATLHAKLLDEGNVRMSSVSGDSLFSVVGSLNAQISLETGPGGDIINGYFPDKPTLSFIGSKRLKIKLGEGNGLVKMSTVNGRLRLNKPK